jgi:hypothetical protein
MSAQGRVVGLGRELERRSHRIADGEPDEGAHGTIPDRIRFPARRRTLGLALLPHPLFLLGRLYRPLAHRADVPHRRLRIGIPLYEQPRSDHSGPPETASAMDEHVRTGVAERLKACRVGRP